MIQTAKKMVCYQYEVLSLQFDQHHRDYCQCDRNDVAPPHTCNNRLLQSFDKKEKLVEADDQAEGR